MVRLGNSVALITAQSRLDESSLQLYSSKSETFTESNNSLLRVLSRSLFRIQPGPRMLFSGMCLILLTTLLTLPEPGFPQCYMSSPRSFAFVAPDCCSSVSKAQITENITFCYEQETTFSDCGKHAFIFETQNKKHYCVDPASSWLPRRFKILQKKGICCLVL